MPKMLYEIDPRPEVVVLKLLYVHCQEKRISTILFPNVLYDDLRATINPL